MKPFESGMATKLEEYMVYRQTLGYTNKNLRSALRPLDEYAQEKKRIGALWDSLFSWDSGKGLREESLWELMGSSPQREASFNF